MVVDEDVRGAKRALRATLLQRLKSQTPDERRRRSCGIVEQIVGSAAFQQARVILGYSALAYEVDPSGIVDAALAHGKRVALPRVVPASKTLEVIMIRDRVNDLEPGPYGVLQPKMRPEGDVPLASIDLVLVPGVGFDQQGHRLGYGKGYYDRLLAGCAPATPRIGLAFACQIVERIPVTAHDVSMTALVSA